MRCILLFSIVASAVGSIGCYRVVAPGHVGIIVKQSGSDRGVQDFPIQSGRVWYNPVNEIGRDRARPSGSERPVDQIADADVGAVEAAGDSGAEVERPVPGSGWEQRDPAAADASEVVAVRAGRVGLPSLQASEDLSRRCQSAA